MRIGDGIAVMKHEKLLSSAHIAQREEGYKNNLLKVVAPKLEKHGIRYLVRGSAPKALMGEPPKNRLVITQAKDMDTVIAFWNDSKDDFQNIATKYANGIRWYAAEGLEQ